ncbi:MAG TPA: bi-domain-containing oxidoreductase [Anaerolineales bacterium]|mgnify:FL=1|jgi:predicted dehydrogenase/threonine dehydrogenase-like Zn-dependent dehydrogenase|nr:bi-domain-containing oxidoreductase [Anaerolineales bacterium]HQX16655.1 bi-domain-containing oxidoreductase [Anaerolineales bacterium]
MKQLLQNIKTGKASVEDVPIPTPREGQALVKVSASLVSAGTERMVVEFAEKSLIGKARSRPDLVKQVFDKARREGFLNTAQAAFNRLDQPMALGYSSAGTIIALGKNMRGFKVGQRVTCAGGGYAVHAEYNIVPKNLLTSLPKNVDFESAAFTTLGAIAMHGFRLAEPQLGENVAVIGLGLLGLLTIQIASAAGCNVLGIDLDPKRIALASSLGLEAVSRQRAESTSQLFTANRGFDVVLICADTSSNDPVELAGVIARDRARVVATGAVGLTLPRKIYYEKELSFINSRSYGPGRYDSNYEENGQDYPLGYVRWTEGRNFQAVVDLMESGKLKVKPLITHRFPIEKATQAYEVITGKKKESFLGVVLTYPDSEWKVESRAVHFPLSKHPKTATVKLGVLGAGLFANSVLLPAIKKVDGIQLIGIASSGGLHAQHAGKKFGFKYATSSDDEIINDPNINTVAILTRHDSHAELVVKALKAGKHVFVEKPLAMNSEQLSVISKQLKKADNGLLMTGFNRRFSPLAESLKSQVSGLRSPLHVHYRINAGYLPPAHWTQDPAIGGGRIIGEACHFVDFITFLVGESPVSVTAHALPDGGKYSEDNVSMTFTFPDGSIGVVDYLANGDKSVPKERVEVFCGGMIAVLDDFISLQITKDGKMKEERGAQDKGWVNEWKAFVKSIREGGEPPIPYKQLIGVTKSTFAAVESLRTMQNIKF